VRIWLPQVQVDQGGAGRGGTSAILDRGCVPLGSLSRKPGTVKIPKYYFNETKQLEHATCCQLLHYILQSLHSSWGLSQDRNDVDEV